MFLGENPESWVYRAEHFFEINNLPEAEKVKVAVVSFGQDEVDWYRWSNNRKKVESWEDLKGKMFEYFRDSGQKSLGARLIRIQHPQTLEVCMKEAQLVNDRNLVLKLARMEQGIAELEGEGSSKGRKDRLSRGCRMQNLEQGWTEGSVFGVMTSTFQAIDAKPRKKEN
ncbi:retrotransposon protein [Cucumis melo var. makuwa]|uniref:Retrotransposon protein n=1 Tax=Cucumis melo var. makuwa TaxID=1194695 RepID=A0A5D3E275_CUCMM|nr:retrotransposon protein [Cucumis melo var. makuwa]TYK29992.1 retrotransposon protein [Cucumis melo var. makuwa]